jgi:Zn-dependent metalloprotease
MGDVRNSKTPLCRSCFIVPPGILRQYSRDTSLDPSERARFAESFAETQRLRQFREAGRVAAMLQRGALAPSVAGIVAPRQHLFDCEHRQSLPGEPISNPAASTDNAIKTVYQVTDKVAEFYRVVLSRNSIDNQGLDLVSSVHYRLNFDNAFWNGQQMVYGDGDGRIFSEFYNSPDVIGHELTHGVTQYESGLQYQGKAGALNESISDVFGATFNQWLNSWSATRPEGWLIGAGIIGDQARTASKTCLRDMVDPSNVHCLSPQPDSYANFDPTADVHQNSGIGNKAYAMFAQAARGNSWDRAIGVWYAACTNHGLSSNATYGDFALLTIAAASNVGLEAEARRAWQTVGVPVATV